MSCPLGEEEESLTLESGDPQIGVLRCRVLPCIPQSPALSAFHVLCSRNTWMVPWGHLDQSPQDFLLWQMLHVPSRGLPGAAKPAQP